MKISAHILLKNEERFSWYSIMSVINHVDGLRIWDIGSSDATPKILDFISTSSYFRDKDFFEVNKISTPKFNEADVRGDMLKRDLDIGTDWLLIVDGDEIWWEDSVRKVVEMIKLRGGDIESIVVPTFNLIGDIFHFQEKAAGRYHLAGQTGHLGLRAINCKIPGLKARGEHGVFNWYDTPKGKRIEEHDKSKIAFLDAPYLHMTHLRRTGGLSAEKEVFKRSRKFKYEIGEEFPKDFYYPEVFFRQRPDFIPSPWETPSFFYKTRALLETPLKKIYRKTLLPFKKHGY